MLLPAVQKDVQPLAVHLPHDGRQLCFAHLAELEQTARPSTVRHTTRHKTSEPSEEATRQRWPAPINGTYVTARKLSAVTPGRRRSTSCATVGSAADAAAARALSLSAATATCRPRG